MAKLKKAATKAAKAAADNLHAAILLVEREIERIRTSFVKVKPTKPRATKPPTFTLGELRALHAEIRNVAWQREGHYNDRASATKKLDAFFGDDVGHLS